VPEEEKEMGSSSPSAVKKDVLSKSHKKKGEPCQREGEGSSGKGGLIGNFSCSFFREGDERGRNSRKKKKGIAGKKKRNGKGNGNC